MAGSGDQTIDGRRGIDSTVEGKKERKLIGNKEDDQKTSLPLFILLDREGGG
jgi:hypothetical protein